MPRAAAAPRRGRAGGGRRADGFRRRGAAARRARRDAARHGRSDRAATAIRAPGRRGAAAARRGAGRARPTAAPRCRRGRRSVPAAPAPRFRRPRSGVGARTSLAWSIRVVSVSCPTAEISGISEEAAARTTISSLNAIKSSRLPPPRATMIRSGRGTAPSRGRRLKPAIAAATCAAAPSPCTATGQISTRRGKRSASRCRMSRITAPVGEVTTPITAGRYGSFCLRSAANSPSAASRRRRSSSILSKAPTPANSIVSMTSWYFERPGKVVSRPVHTTSMPSSGLTARRIAVIRQHTASSTASASLSAR